MYQYLSIVSSRLDSGYAGENDSLVAKWELVTVSLGKKVVGCKWVYIVKLNPDRSLARLKARLPKDIHMFMDWTMWTPPQSQKWHLCEYLCRWQRHTTGHFISWISKMLFSMIFLMRKFNGATIRLWYSGRVCEGLQVEEVTLRSETVSESLVWALRGSGIQKFGLCRAEKNYSCVLADTRWEENPTDCVYR